MKLNAITGSTGLTLASLVGFVLAHGTYTLIEDIAGEGFYDSFNFEAIPDPTQGRVNYVNETVAKALNLTFATDETFILRADDFTVLNAKGAGRDSVRIRSNNQYTTHVTVFDMQHMPEGCGTWPAVWETNESDWPDGGEVDIVEGVNDVEPNQSTLHTSDNCTIPPFTTQLGTTLSTNCSAAFDFNEGCAVELAGNNSYGPAFNRIGGGWYAMERTNHYINVWFWARSDPFAPDDVTCGASTIDTGKWGIPAAHFPNTQCDLASHFGPNNIIINLTFCGAKAGNSTLYTAAGCPSDCETFVNDNPSAFENAYFQFSSIKVYA
ncbi:hypothetical protein AZE42_06891 [Rhizopogon vesiculosus]|uniref:GH16 domain-containing protein n=1 Tax=Rhizopogon vesiculosus TaxID=180088 RepID=A0A1J8PWH8_9AGAM|nr:hypothetical protein AZE42_06891 [Rhizopogon vesiculosus]